MMSTELNRKHEINLEDQRMAEKRIVITGIGLLTPIGHKKEDIRKNLLNDKPSITERSVNVEDKEYRFPIHQIPPLHFTDFGWSADFLKSLGWLGNDINDDLRYFLATVKLAIDDAGLMYNSDDNELGFILGNVYPGAENFIKKVFNLFFDLEKKNKKPGMGLDFEKLYNLGVKEAFDLHSFVFLHNVGKVFNFHGFSLFVNNGCATGAYAIESASSTIKNGLADTVIVAAAEKPDIVKYLWFDSLQMYAKSGKIKPFAADRDGFIFGEGGGAFILEDLEHALKRKAHIYAEYLGGGFNFDGWKISVPPLGGNSYYKSIVDAFERCKIIPDKVDLLVPHGSGTRISDSFESKMIAKAFSLDKGKPLITALKPYIGYNVSSNVIMETGIMLLALTDGIIPPILNCAVPDSKLKIKNNLVKGVIQHADVDYFMKTDWGFGGFSSAMVFKVEPLGLASSATGTVILREGLK